MTAEESDVISKLLFQLPGFHAFCQGLQGVEYLNTYLYQIRYKLGNSAAAVDHDLGLRPQVLSDILNHLSLVGSVKFPVIFNRHETGHLGPQIVVYHGAVNVPSYTFIKLTRERKVGLQKLLGQCMIKPGPYFHVYQPFIHSAVKTIPVERIIGKRRVPDNKVAGFFVQDSRLFNNSFHDVRIQVGPVRVFINIFLCRHVGHRGVRKIDHVMLPDRFYPHSEIKGPYLCVFILLHHVGRNIGV